jgi:Tfp pilus assembly protein PilF
VEGWIRSSLLHSEVQPATWTLIAAAVVIVAVCFANSVPNDFILDDYAIVALNPAIRTIAPLQVFKTPYWGEKSNAGIYRPLTIFSFSLEYPLWHRWAGGYRLTNLLLHTINGLLVFFLARGLLQSVPAAGAAAAIYLAHPAHTEPVISLAGRSELLAAMFFLLAWIFYRQDRVVLFIAAFGLSLLSKENAIAFPAVVALDALITHKEAQNIRRKIVGFAAVCTAAVVYLGIRFWVLGGLGVPQSAQYFDGHWSFAQRELTSGRAFLKYFQLLIAPINVTGDYDYNSIPIATLTDWVGWAGLIAVALTILFAIWMLRSHTAVGFSILFFYIAMLPNSNWIMPTSIIMSERALYLPSLGICLLGGVLWARLPRADLRKVVAAGVIVTAALLCIAHNYIWRDDLTYFRNMVRVLPNNLRGRQGFGTALAEQGQPEQARVQFEAGLQINRNAPLLVGLSQALIQIDHGCRRAHAALDEAAAYAPTDPFVSWLQGSCFEMEGSVDKAEARYRKAVNDARFPDPKLLADWGRTLKQIGKPAEAEEAFKRAALLR